MANYKSSYTGQQIDAGIGKANTALQPVAGKGLSTNDYTDADKTKLSGINMSTKQDTLVSGENIKTINNQSLLGEGNIVISGSGSTITNLSLDGTVLTITTTTNTLTLDLAPIFNTRNFVYYSNDEDDIEQNGTILYIKNATVTQNGSTLNL